MGGLFSVRLAKGVRISASSRGLRAHVGPRAARLHIGGGRTGVSAGAGPFTYYTSLTRGSASGSRSPGATKAEAARAEKEREFLELREALQSILEIHRVEFPGPVKPSVPPPVMPDLTPFLKRRISEETAGIPVWRRRARTEAKKRARVAAEEDVAREQKRLRDEHARVVVEIDAEWRALNDNDPAVVMAVVEDAFEDNDAPAAPVDVEGSTLSLVVLAPSFEETPERKPDVTPSGKPTVKRMTKAERADTYLTLVCGHLLATIREALAVAPGIAHVRAVVVRRADPDVYGNPRMEALLAASYARANLERVRWDEALATDIVQQAADELVWSLKGRPPMPTPLPLADQPQLEAFLGALNDQVTSA